MAGRRIKRRAEPPFPQQETLQEVLQVKGRRGRSGKGVYSVFVNWCPTSRKNGRNGQLPESNTRTRRAVTSTRAATLINISRHVQA